MGVHRQHVCLAAALLSATLLLAGCLDNSDPELMMKRRALDFFAAVDTPNSKLLSRMTGEEGILLARWFLSGNGTRGADLLAILPRELPSDLTFDLIEGEEPVKLKTEWQLEGRDLSKMKVIYADVDVEWDVLSWYTRQDVLGSIAGDEENLGEGVVLYVMDDGSFYLAQFCGSMLPYSRWALFQKQGDGYTLRAIVLFY